MEPPRFTITPSPDLTVTAPLTHGIRLYDPSGTLRAVAGPGQSVAFSTADMEPGAMWRVEPSDVERRLPTRPRWRVVGCASHGASDLLQRDDGAVTLWASGTAEAAVDAYERAETGSE